MLTANNRIDTQDVIFGVKNSKRVIEIGPTNTLTAMAKRTLSTKYGAHDAANSISRKVLSVDKDSKEINFEIDLAEEEESQGTVQTDQTVKQAMNSASPLLPVATVDLVAHQAVPIPDVPILAIDILRALTAQKLRRPLSQLSSRESIKELAKGYSTQCRCWRRLITISSQGNPSFKTSC